jgi:hypothetical protein
MPSPLSPPVPFTELCERVDNALDRWFSGPRGRLPPIDSVRRERRCGSFSRSMTLPAGVDPSKIEAKVKHGVAEVTIPLSAGSKKESVTITPIGG